MRLIIAVLFMLVSAMFVMSCSRTAESGRVYRMTITVQYSDGQVAENPKVWVVAPANVRLMRILEPSGEPSSQFIFESDSEGGAIDIRASEPGRFLVGRYMGKVKDVAVIQLEADTSSNIHGFVVDKNGLPVKYATIGTQDPKIISSTRRDGSFSLPVGKGDGQAVLLTIKNGPCESTYWSNAGKDPVHLRMDCGPVAVRRPTSTVSLLK